MEVEIKNNTKCKVECQVIDDTTTRIVINDGYVPKEGEFVRTKRGNILIFKKLGNANECRRYASFAFGRLAIGGEDSKWCGYIYDIDGPATPEQIQFLTDKLKEQGKRWNAEKKIVEDIPTFKVGDWFIPHKPKDWLDWKNPYWDETDMDEFDGKTLQVGCFIQGKGGQYLRAEDCSFHPDWCEKVEAPKPEPKIGEMCIFWDSEKKYAQCAILGKINNDGDFTYEKVFGTRWKNCIPFESIEQYKNLIKE